jgi:F-type H+-transporting ATPase subunit delta
MIAGSLARRYARALLDIGIAQGNFEKLGDELDALAAAYSSSRDLAEALSNPVFPRAKRRAVLEAVLKKMGVSPVTHNFALLILERERTAYLPAIARELRAMVDERAGRVRAVITSAMPLPTAAATQLRKVLEAATGKTVAIEKHEDPALIGGLVAKIGDVVYDGSVRTQLAMMREQFLVE